MTAEEPNWLAAGKGTPPRIGWSFATDAPLVGLAMARESGETLVADDSGGLYRLDRRGRVASLTRGFKSLAALAWSDTAGRGAAALSDSTLCWLDRGLKVRWSLTLHEPILAVGVDSHGHYAAVSLASGETLVYSGRKRQIGRYTTQRPLRFLRFVTAEPRILGAAEYGLLCCHELDGTELWDQRLWSNVGDLTVTGDGETIYIARFNQGVQRLDRDGDNLGSYIIRGTPSRVSTSFRSRRLAVATVERDLYWLDGEGELVWASELPDDLCGIQTDGLGDSVVCGFRSGRVDQLEWTGRR